MSYHSICYFNIALSSTTQNSEAIFVLSSEFEWTPLHEPQADFNFSTTPMHLIRASDPPIALGRERKTTKYYGRQKRLPDI